MRHQQDLTFSQEQQTNTLKVLQFAAKKGREVGVNVQTQNHFVWSTFRTIAREWKWFYIKPDC